MSRNPCLHRLVLLALLLLALAAGPASAQQQETCLGCHGESFQGEEAKAVLSFDASPHGALDCVGCHADAAEVPHPRKPAVVDCSGCHAETTEIYSRSIHGAKARDGDVLAATCKDCHGSHGLRRGADPASKTYALNLPATCGNCHNEQVMATRHDLKVPDAYKRYVESAHGKGVLKSGLLVSASCADCHGSHEIQPSSDIRSTLSRQNTPATCGACHAGIEKEFRRGIHGSLWSQGDEKVPICTTCHSSHGVDRSDDRAFQLQTIGGCGNCHTHQIETYRETYHGQVTALGFVAVAKCTDCHRYHDVLPSKDPASATHPANLVATCAKCHPDASESFVKFQAHADHRDRDKNPVLYYTYLFMTTLLTGVFLFFGVHTALWLYRSLRERGIRHRRDGT